MDVTNILAFSTLLLSSFSGLFIGYLKIRSLPRGVHKKLENLKTVYSLSDKFGSELDKQFFTNEWMEIYFLMLTGIETNCKSIPKYFRFKDKLGANYKWSDIREVQSYLNFDDEDIKININQYNNILWKIAVLFFVLSVISMLFIFSYIPQFKLVGLYVYFLLVFLAVMPAIIGYLMVIDSYSIFKAQWMEKRLSNFHEQ